MKDCLEVINLQSRLLRKREKEKQSLCSSGINLRHKQSELKNASDYAEMLTNVIFIYLFNSCDNAIHPQGICGLGKTKEMNPVDGPRPVYHNKVNPQPSAVRCAQVSGYELPLQESVTRKRESKQEHTATKNRHPSGWNTGITLRPSGLLPPPSPTPPTHPSLRRRLHPRPSRRPSPYPLPTALET
jgi:hypothetical protein